MPGTIAGAMAVDRTRENIPDVSGNPSLLDMRFAWNAYAPCVVDMFRK
jgi:hypothetical protein